MLWLVLMACGQAGTEEVAEVMLVDGEAFIARDGVRVGAVAGAPLGRGDVLETGPNGAIVVQLRNDHVVRIDADLELPVSEIVMLDAPKSAITPGAQLAELMYPEEEARLGEAFARAERVAGWHARLSAAVAPSGVTRAPEAVAEVEEEAKERSAPVSADAADAPMAEPVIAPSRAVDDAPQDKSKRLASRPAAPPAVAAPGATPQPAPENFALPTPKDALDEAETRPSPSPSPSPSPTTLAALNARFTRKGDLRACVVTWANALPKRPKSLPIRLVVRDGVIARAVVEQGGLRLPACALEALEGVGVDAPDGARLTVDL